MSKRKVRLTIHVDDERNKFGLVDEKGPLYMEDLQSVMQDIEARLLSKAGAKLSEKTED